MLTTVAIFAALGLLIGLAAVVFAVSRILHGARETRAALDRAQTDFAGLITQHFDAWHLTPAERDVALFAVKGMSTIEIADLRGTSEGTVKAQCNAIYRKAGVAGRIQLLGVFIEDLVDGVPGLEEPSAMTRDHPTPANRQDRPEVASPG